MSGVGLLIAVIAAQPAATPSLGLSATIVPAGHFELTVAGAVDRLGAGTGYGASLTVRYSLTDRFQLWATTPYAVAGQPAQEVRAVDGIDLGAKLLLTPEQDRWPALAVSLSVCAPTSREVAALQNTLDGVAMAYATRTVGVVQLDAAAAVGVFDLERAPFVQAMASISSTFTVLPWLQVSSGAYSWLGDHAQRPTDGGAYAELDFFPVDWLAVGVGAELGFFPDRRAYSVYVGIGWVPTAGRPVVVQLEAPPTTVAVR